MNYIIEDSVMSSIADSIRAKLGTSEAFQVTDMASAIDSIPSGGGDDDWKNYVEGNTTTVSGNASKIRDGAFAYTNITEANFPSCTTIGIYAFSNCKRLTTISFPKCITINSSAFFYCDKLNDPFLPECTTINSEAFYYCKLTRISLPNCTTIGISAFGNCLSLATTSFPECTTISNSAFYYCINLTTISFPKCTTVRNGAFYNCSKLKSLYINTSNCALVNMDVFQNTPIAKSSYLGYYGSIYVPSEYVETYKSATNWVTYANRITAIPE